MRVLLMSVDSDKSKGGIAEWTKLYKIGCLQRDIEFDVVDTSAIGKRAVQITSRRNLYDEYKRFCRIRADLKKHLNNTKFDIVHFNTNIGAFGIIRDYYLARIIKANNIPIILHFHCDVPFWVKNKLVRFFLRRIIELSSSVFVLNNSSKSYLEKEFDKESIIIPNFIDIEQVVAEKAISKKIRKCIFVGRVSFLKGIRELLIAASKFPNIHFLLVGELSKESVSLDIPNNVELKGIRTHDEVLKLLDESDVFVLPSYSEGFSIALAEAMARGLPAIVTNVGANADMIENKGGIVVPVGQAESLIEAIQRIDSISIRKKMSNWNIQKIRSVYNMETVMRKIEIEYQKGKGNESI